MAVVEGIDISNVNGNVDLAHEKQARGLGFVIHKATEGLTFVDGLYAQRRTQAAALELLWGAYHFAHPATDPQRQAEHFISTAQLGPHDIAALDFEAQEGSWTAMAQWAEKWLATVRGYHPGPVIFYANINFLRNTPTTNICKLADLWAAEPGNATAPAYLDRWKTWRFHQYGISGGLDQDHFNGTLEDLRVYVGLDSPAPARNPSWPWWDVEFIPADHHERPVDPTVVQAIHIQAPDSGTAERMIPAGSELTGVQGPKAA